MMYALCSLLDGAQGSAALPKYKAATAAVVADAPTAGAPVVYELQACLIVTKLAQAHGLHVSMNTTMYVALCCYTL
jgi:hypothetical protein